MDSNTEVLVCSLKSAICRQTHKAKFNNECFVYASNQFLDVLKLACLNKEIHTHIEAMVWECVDESPYQILKQVNSADLGIYSHIGKYVSKKTGKESLAHFTIYNSYLGSVNKLGDKPVSYKGNFSIKTFKEKFIIDLSVLDTCNNFTDLFVLKPLGEDDIPMSTMIEKRKAELKEKELQQVSKDDIPMSAMIEKRKADLKVIPIKDIVITGEVVMIRRRKQI
jgi:hypothetical protein